VIDTSRFAALVATAFAIIVIPGPSVLFVISRGVSLGRRAALATVLGNTAGLGVQVASVAAGLGAVVERSIAVFTVMKVLGAAYLVFLGVRAYRKRRSLAGLLTGEVAAAPVGRIIREGFFVGVTNPKTVILFAAVLPQFVDADRGHVTLQLLALGAVCLVIALLSDSTWGLLAGSARAWLARRPGRLAAVGGTGGLITVALGLRLALTHRHD
jgi:threonine/homoserine/homoserine lactone efflux protein